MKFYKSYENELISNEDILTVLEVKDEVALTQNEIATNRSIMKALLLAEEMKGEISVEKDENFIQITIRKDK